MKSTLLVYLAAALLAGAGVAHGAEDDAQGWAIEQKPGEIRVLQGGELFTSYRYPAADDEELPQPIFYPVIGPGGVGMTRNYPMAEVEGEARDHPHHRSLWFAHGDVNGVDFWTQGEGKGRIVQTALRRADAATSGVVIATENAWIGPGGGAVMTDRRTHTIGGQAGARSIDYEITLVASQGPVRLGDTKEGMMAIRTHPLLRLSADPQGGVPSVNGQALNSAGERDKALWGRRAAWVDYWGEIGPGTVGIAIFDHPANPRHPTWWHARDYGLVAANPFGIHEFEPDRPAGAGEMTLEAGAELTFRYRFLFHEGDAEAAGIESGYQTWAGQ